MFNIACLQGRQFLTKEESKQQHITPEAFHSPSLRRQQSARRSLPQELSGHSSWDIDLHGISSPPKGLGQWLAWPFLASDRPSRQRQHQPVSPLAPSQHSRHTCSRNGNHAAAAAHHCLHFHSRIKSLCAVPFRWFQILN